MKKRIIILFFIFLLICSVSVSAYPVKNSFCACFLSSLGNAGLPGTFGWGHLYAGDLKGFLIFQIGGSTSSLLFIKSMISISSTVNDKDPVTGESEDIDKTVLAAAVISGAGTLAFSIMNFITGMQAADKYNTEMWDRNHRLAFDFIPENNNAKFGISYKM